MRDAHLFCYCVGRLAAGKERVEVLDPLNSEMTRGTKPIGFFFFFDCDFSSRASAASRWRRAVSMFCSDMIDSGVEARQTISSTRLYGNCIIPGAGPKKIQLNQILNSVWRPRQD